MSNQGGSWSWGSQSGRDAAQQEYVNIPPDTPMYTEEDGSWYEFMHGYVPESTSNTDSRNHWYYGTWDVPVSPYHSSMYSPVVSVEELHGYQYPNTPAGHQSHGASASRRSGSVEQHGQQGHQPLDPTLTMVHNLLSQVLHQGAGNGTPPPPDFLKIVTMMKTLGTYRFEGNPDPDEADAWMQCLEKNFAATRCPAEFKKDVAVYYLEKEALGWWNSLDRQTGHTINTWETFQTEFRRKYFPPEARDRMEQAFVTLSQGNRSVREYEAEVIKLQKYVTYGYGDEGAMVRKFLQGLKPEIGGRLQAVTYTNMRSKGIPPD